MTDQIERAKSAQEDAARARCNDAVIALHIPNRVLAIDLMTGQWSDDPLWPDTGNHVLPFKRRAGRRKSEQPNK
jgi:hypothetical protein